MQILAGVVWSLLKTLTVLLVVSLRHWLLLQWMHSTVKAQKVLKNSLKEFKGSKRQKRTKLGFLCTLKRRIKYKFPNAGCYGNVTHIKAWWSCGKSVESFLAHHMQKRNRNNLGWRWFWDMNHWMLFFDTLLSEQGIQRVWTRTSFLPQ